jgi:hypothetical protein
MARSVGLPRRRKGVAVIVAAISTLTFTLVLTKPLVAAAPSVPMVGEIFLTPAERRAAIESMTPQERANVGHLFADNASGLLVAYARAEIVIIQTPDGPVLEPVGFSVGNGLGNLVLPSHATAGNFDTGKKAGTDLFLSMVVSKTRSTSPYEWEIYSYAQWGKLDSYSPAGMDCCNDYKDYLGVAWAGGLALYSDSGNGVYQRLCQGEPALNVARHKVAANTGIAHSFNEWWDPDNCNMYWGHTFNRIRETTWRNRLSNATTEYIHTWGGHSYSIGFSATGPNVSISPTTETWSHPLYISFTH